MKFIPKNYYCSFTLDLKDDLVYGVEVYRYDRYKSRETIDLDVIVTFEDETQNFDFISDQVIRKNSLYSRMSSTSKA